MKKLFMYMLLIQQGYALAADQSVPTVPKLPLSSIIPCSDTRLRCQTLYLGKNRDVLLRSICRRSLKEKMVSGAPKTTSILSMVHVLIEGATEKLRSDMYEKCLERQSNVGILLSPQDYSDVFLGLLSSDELRSAVYKRLEPKVSILSTELEAHPTRQRAGSSPRLVFPFSDDRKSTLKKNVTCVEQNCRLFDLGKIRLMVPAYYALEEIAAFTLQPNVKEMLRREVYDVFKQDFEECFPDVTAILFIDEEGSGLSNSGGSEEHVE